MYDTLDKLLHDTPFKPFRVRMSNGESYTVKHPELAILLKTQLVIGLPKRDCVVICALLHVAAVNTLKRKAK
jgi:hypothetical protein